MLTPRGFWFLLTVFSVLIASITLSATTLTLVCLTLLAWFLAQWFLFQCRIRLSARRFSVVRVLRTNRGEVESIWARQKVDVTLRVLSDAPVILPYVIVSERVPALATVHAGDVHLDGTLSNTSPLEWTYSLVCASPGRLRFEGIKIDVVDPQGFFTFATFVRTPKEYRVLPAMVIESTQTPFVKLHNTLPLLGSHRHARPGGSSELLDLRDYQPGDPPKLIAWKITARRDRLITKEFESEVPIRCTIFLDTSNSVRIGPAGATALCRLVEIAAGVAQSNASERDLTGLCIFDDQCVRDQIRPGRGSRHMMQMLERLTHVAGLIPFKQRATVRELLPYAYGLVQDVYPEYLDSDVNYFPWWLPWWSPQPSWVIPRWAPRYWSRLSGGLQREQRWRKEISAILAVRYDLGPGGLTMLMEDDVQCAKQLQRFLAEHQVACPFAPYDADGVNAFAAPEKTHVLADALLKAVTHGKDNELFVLCVDLFDCEETMSALEGAICVARARHHQVIVIAPWPIGVPAPARESTKARVAFETLDAQTLLQQIFTDRLQTAFAKVQRALGRLGVPVLCAGERDSVHWILHRMRRLRIQERGVR